MKNVCCSDLGVDHLLFSDSESIENRFNVYLDNIRYDAKFIFEK